MTTGQALTEVKRKKVAMMSVAVMSLIHEKMTGVMSFLHPSIQMRKMPMIGQMPRAQGELELGAQKLTSLS